MGPADGSTLRPDVLCPLDEHDLPRQTLRIGRRAVELGELFQIERTGRDDLPHHRLTLAGLPIVDRLGAQMTAGELIIEGDAGDDLGASMTGGHIRVTGSAGDRAGGPDHGQRRGMNGGTLVIEGGAGEHVGLRMRRGILAVRGRAGRFPGYRMLAGTLILMQGGHDHPGVEMRRGTLLYPGPADRAFDPGPHFACDGAFPASELPFLALVYRAIDAEGSWTPRHTPDDQGVYRAWSGDRNELNKGELWQWVSQA